MESQGEAIVPKEHGGGGDLTGLNIRKSNRNPHFMHEWHHRVHLSHSSAANIYSGKYNKFSLD